MEQKTVEVKELKSSMKTRHVVMMSLGGAIGSGLFVGLGSTLVNAGPAAILSYILAGLTLFVVMYGVGRMVVHQKVHSDVGMSGIIKPYVGEHWGHFTDWVYWATWMAVLIAEQAGVAMVLSELIPGVPLWVFSLVVAAVATAINLISVRTFAETEYWLSFIKVAVIVILIVVGIGLLLLNNPNLGFHLSAAQKAANASVAPSFAPKGIGGIITSLLVVIFSFGGSELAAVTVAETENPEYAIPRAIRGVLFRIISFYVVPIFLFVELLPWKNFTAGAESPFATIFKRVGIPFADKIILVVIVIAIFSAVNSAIYATSRSLYSRVQHSESGIGKSLSYLNKNQVPVRAIYVSSGVLFLGVILSAALGKGFWQFVASSISFTITIVWFILLLAAIIMYMKHKETGKWWLTVITIIVALVLAAIFIAQVITQLKGSGWMSWGVLVFAVVICLFSYFSYHKKS
ncbi:MAG: amino acid permease [Streptococcaceae bacterium]|jgi:L-asparagine transporter-like permease|nr:amino acid permease [Streptococcaceae bacterium]